MVSHTLGSWFATTTMVLFWVYAAIIMLSSCSVYLVLWSTQAFPAHTMTPVWIFPAYPLFLMAPFASNLIDALPDSVTRQFGALPLQGTAFMVSLMIYSVFIYRLMMQKLPTRPGTVRYALSILYSILECYCPSEFVSVGPSGFTVAILVHLGAMMVKVIPVAWLGHPESVFAISDLVAL